MSLLRNFFLNNSGMKAKASQKISEQKTKITILQPKVKNEKGR